MAIDQQHTFAHLVRRHPCYNPEAHGRLGRIHLPVSSSCNIRCRFCRRSFNAEEHRPGVSRKVLAPEQAMKVLERALRLCPAISVVRVAGPGESLATEHALITLAMAHERHPDLIGCLSTNGLRLAEHVDAIVAAGVCTVSVTVNAVEPEILQHICGGVEDQGRLKTGVEGAETLISAQLEGIRLAAGRGLVVKTNMVLIPEVNDGHVGAVARTMAEAGASLINVLPLIPEHEMAYMQAPDCHAVNAAREVAEQYLPVFRHCRQCRADACGIPGAGVDFAEQLYEQRVETFSHG